MTVISIPIPYIPDPLKGRPLFNCQIFVGIEDLDPEIVGNQKQLNVIQEDGTVVPVQQPFATSAGGVPIYNGATVRLDVDGNYSLKILDNLGAQKYYIENVFEGEPITEANLINDLSQTYTFPTVTAFKESLIEFPDGKVICLLDRGADFTKITGTGTANTFNIIASIGVNQSVELIINVDVDLIHWGAGLGLTDDRPIFQSAIDQGFTGFKNSDGTYLISTSGTTIPYRATTTAVGVAMASNVTMLFSGYNSIVKVIDSGDCVPFTANAKTNITYGNFRLEGNAANQTASLLFGIYSLNCTGVNQVGTIWIDETKDNTIETIGCTNVNFNNTINNTSTGGGSIGGGPQFEDCTNVNLGLTTGDTSDDLVSVIAHNGDCTKHTLGNISGSSDNARALFIGQSSSALAQRTIKGVTAKVNSNNCGIAGTTAAVTLTRGAVFENIDIDIVDSDSYRTLQTSPYDGTFNGQMRNINLDVMSNNAHRRAVNIIHDDNAATTAENCTLNAQVFNANSSDNASETDAVRIEEGEGWNIDLDITYPTGKVNAGQSLVLGGSTGVNDTLKNSKVTGIIRGGNKNIQLNATNNVLLDGLMLRETEDPNNTNLDITALSSSVTIGTLIRDGEVQDLGANTRRSDSQLLSSADNNDTGALTTEQTLTSYTLPANWMGKTGTLHIKASGVISGAAGNKTLKFYFGATSHTLHAAANDTGDWSVDIYIRQAGDRASQRLDMTTVYGSAVLQTEGVSDVVSTTAPVVIKFTGQTADGGDLISQRMMIITGA